MQFNVSPAAWQPPLLKTLPRIDKVEQTFQEESRPQAQVVGAPAAAFSHYKKRDNNVWAQYQSPAGGEVAAGMNHGTATVCLGSRDCALPAFPASSRRLTNQLLP